MSESNAFFKMTINLAPLSCKELIYVSSNKSRLEQTQPFRCAKYIAVGSALKNYLNVTLVIP